MENIQALQRQTLDISKLEPRKQAELKFHNKNRDEALTQSLPQDTFELLHGNKKFYSVVQKSRDFVAQWIAANAKDKVFLDYACGNGELARLALLNGAKLSIGIDISDVSIRNARKIDDACVFIHGDCEATGLQDSSIDVVVCSGVLHHLFLPNVFKELQRILRPGGKVLCIEALDYNPLIKLYRMLTPAMRTEWEASHILSMRDVKLARQFFAVEYIRFWHLFSILAVPFRKTRFFQPLLKWLEKIDETALRIPGLRLMAWQFTFELRKPYGG